MTSTTTSLRRRWIARLAIAATSASIGLVATGAVLSPASADAPVKVAWWNFAAAGGQAAPAPDTNDGGMRVGASSQQTLAIGAVQYNLPKDGSATLELAITAISSNANAPVLNAIVACPTKDASWKPGGDQDGGTAPGWDCEARQFVGHLSADQSTMTFQVDGSADLTDGVLSLAIVPQHSTAIPYVGTDPGTGTDLTAPFVVDFDKPGPNSFQSDAPSSSDSSDSPSSSTPPPPPATGNTGSTGSSGATVPPATSTGGAINVPPATTTDPGTTPVVAGQQPASTGGGGTAPVAAVAPAAKDNKHDLLLMLLVLLLFAILFTQNASQRAPRRLVGAVAPAADGTTPLPVAYPAGGDARGLGRFAKPRSGAARPLI
jgi:hypothetical protein